jgi:hypothetical protein
MHLWVLVIRAHTCFKSKCIKYMLTIIKKFQ